MNRRAALSIMIGSTASLAMGGCALVSRAKLLQPALAVTIDDFDIADAPLLSGDERHGAILTALRRHRVQAAGLITGKNADTPHGPRYLTQWSDAGHIIGNHTYSHPYYSGRDVEGFMADILRAEAVLGDYPGFQKIFRFPYLSEGRTPEGRDEMRRLLSRHGYRNAHVTIDTSDWYINSRLVRRLRTDPSSDIEAYRRYYLDHLWDRSTYYDGLHRTLFGAPGVHTLLLHHNLASGLFLDDALTMFASRGWRLVGAKDALAEPLYQQSPDVLPAGQSLLWSLAKQHGGIALREPGENDAYEKPEMDRLGL